tara:strand:- start:836 stop:1054 length:219 start_codon:yes stop_codon:yes gene_type:complete
MTNRLNITSIDKRFLKQHSIQTNIFPADNSNAWIVEMSSLSHKTGSTHISFDLNDAYSTALDVITKAIAQGD